jgi:Domain of unknown function (DUF4129)
LTAGALVASAAQETTTSDPAPETPPRPPGLGPSPARTLAILSIALLVLLGLVALASRGDRPFTGESGSSREPSNLFWDYLFSVSLGVAVVGIGVSVWLMFSRDEGRAKLYPKQPGMLVLFFLSALVIGFLIGADRVRDLGGGQDVSFLTPSEQQRRASELPRSEEERSIRPAGILLPLLAGAVALAYVLARRRYRRRQPERLTDAELTDELAALLDDTLDDLRAEPDPRRAVIAAYARTERALGAYGFPRRPFEAPLEYLDRIAAPLHEVQPSARRLVFELTHLFERAKFSSHAIDAEMKDDAIATLAALRDELRAQEAA